MTKDENQPKRTKQPWPTKEAMEQVYERKLWGGNEDDFYSGDGSHLQELVEPYVDVVSNFLASFPTPLTICDLGCGDFHVGQRLHNHCKNYIAVDIVPALIERNKAMFKSENLSFHCLDLVKDELPQGDCAILRQVLQHLSNAEVQHILTKLSTYKYVILTEHLPQGDFEPNKDIISGQGIRLKKQSGLDITAAPFHFKLQSEKVVLKVNLTEGRGCIVTRVLVI